METGRFSTLLILLALPFIALIIGCTDPRNGRYQQLPEFGQWRPTIEELERQLEAYEALKMTTRRIFPIYVQDPDGRKRIWAVSQDAKEQMNPILSVYTQKMIEGTSFHEVTSWKDIGKLETTVNEDRDRMIWKLFNEISYLKLRFTIMEKKLEDN